MYKFVVSSIISCLYSLSGIKSIAEIALVAYSFISSTVISKYFLSASNLSAISASLCAVAGIDKREEIGTFARNFGIAFQIKDDLLNVLKTDKTKPALSDIHNGIYTAPVIYLNQDCPDTLNLSEAERKTNDGRNLLDFAVR